ncbi:MAG: nucleotidyltransferase family protein [Oscillochloridaceae bacterium umkhey_bin13]
MIYGVLLAAGTSARMGQPKQLLDWQGQPLVRHVAATALASQLDGLVVVCGAVAPAVSAALADLAESLHLVVCSDYAAGQAASLRCGLAALPAGTRAALIVLVDQPLITTELINHMLAHWQAEPTALALVPQYQGQRGNPVILAAALFPELAALHGDTGARAILAKHHDRVRWWVVDDPAVVTDIDTPETYAHLRDG